MSEMIYEIKDLEFTYPGSKRKILNKVNLELKQGEVLEILGPNGAGKTTLLNCMMGTNKPDGGQILLSGEDITKLSAKQIAIQVGFVPQAHTPAFAYTVKDFVLMGVAPSKGVFDKPSKADEERCMEVLNSVNIAHLADLMYTEISGGERQQVLIARAIALQPKIILFDEPTAHLDYGNQYRTLKMVRAMSEQGFAVVITTHDPNQALLLGGKAAILNREGTLVSGPVDEIICEENLKRVYNCELKLVSIDSMGRIACVTPKL